MHKALWLALVVPLCLACSDAPPDPSTKTPANKPPNRQHPATAPTEEALSPAPDPAPHHENPFVVRNEYHLVEGDELGAWGTPPTPAVTTSVSQGLPTVRGDLDAQIARRVMRRSVPALARCYERARRKTPSLRGALSVLLVVGGTGEVLSASIPTKTFPAAMETCILNEMRTLTFPKPTCAVLVEIQAPFHFAPPE